MKDWWRVGLDRSRPIIPRHFAQALHFSPLAGLKGLADAHSKGPDPAAAWRKTMPAFTAFRRAEVNIARLTYASVAALAILTLSGLQNPICAAEIRLLSAASIQEVFKEIIGDFERASGHKMIINYGTMGAITGYFVRAIDRNPSRRGQA
jgi:hypothetical protein